MKADRKSAFTTVSAFSAFTTCFTWLVGTAFTATAFTASAAATTASVTATAFTATVAALTAAFAAPVTAGFA
jgi:hypothetical protein